MKKEGKNKLLKLDEKTKKKCENIRDMILGRFGSTGIQDAISRAIEKKGFVPCYHVKNINNFTTDESGLVFRDCRLLKAGTTVKEFALKINKEWGEFYQYAEGK